jgi:hypothetical protein
LAKQDQITPLGLQHNLLGGHSHGFAEVKVYARFGTVHGELGEELGHLTAGPSDQGLITCRLEVERAEGDGLRFPDCRLVNDSQADEERVESLRLAEAQLECTVAILRPVEADQYAAYHGPTPHGPFFSGASTLWHRMLCSDAMIHLVDEASQASDSMHSCPGLP